MSDENERIRRHSKRQRAIRDLRAAADWFEKHPGVEVPDLDHLLSYQGTREKFVKQVAAAGGGKKAIDDSWFFFNVQVTPSFVLKIYTTRENVCERVQVGTKILAAEPERILPALPEREEPIYETRCPESILALAQPEPDTERYEEHAAAAQAE